MKKFFRMLGLIILIGNIGFAEYTVKDGKVYWDDELVVKYVNGGRKDWEQDILCTQLQFVGTREQQKQ